MSAMNQRSTFSGCCRSPSLSNTQCDAVSTKLVSMSVPPQKWLPDCAFCIETTLRSSPMRALLPPTMKLTIVTLRFCGVPAGISSAVDASRLATTSSNKPNRLAFELSNLRTAILLRGTSGIVALEMQSV